MAPLRDHGLRIGELEPGPGELDRRRAGVRVGHVTIVARRAAVARTGVTAVVPPAPAGRAPARPCSTARGR